MKQAKDLQKGDEIRTKEFDNTITVQARLDDLVFLSDPNQPTQTSEFLYQHIDEVQALIDNGDWQIVEKKERWVLKLEQGYFIPDPNTENLYFHKVWADDRFDEWRLEHNLVCRTAEEAIEKANLMLKAVQ